MRTRERAISGSHRQRQGFVLKYGSVVRPVPGASAGQRLQEGAFAASRTDTCGYAMQHVSARDATNVRTRCGEQRKQFTLFTLYAASVPKEPQIIFLSNRLSEEKMIINTKTSATMILQPTFQIKIRH